MEKGPQSKNGENNENRKKSKLLFSPFLLRGTELNRCEVSKIVTATEPKKMSVFTSFRKSRTTSDCCRSTAKIKYRCNATLSER